MSVFKDSCGSDSVSTIVADEAESLLRQAPTESYADIGGLEDQIMEMKEAGQPGHGQEDVKPCIRN